MLEVIYVRDEPLEAKRKRAFAQEAEHILEDVLGTPRGRMRLTIQHLKPEDSLGLLEKPKAGE